MESKKELASLKCEACSGIKKALSLEEVEKLLLQLPEWELVKADKIPRIQRKYRMKNFMAGIDFFGEIAKIAEKEGHHPDLHLEAYQFVSICIYTHSVKGLTESDFILAAKIDKVEPKLSKYHKSKSNLQEVKKTAKKDKVKDSGDSATP
ncbi:hypothetical protein AAMO2058_000687600 [Amorphochlora amoebiformis]|mmetsp:Transcript_10542/g.16677  ORF Transcript_10542/g.16677 Transcript_10542/m.16677 type:complete len:150 (-) Transcript_10542:262-711(-)